MLMPVILTTACFAFLVSGIHLPEERSPPDDDSLVGLMVYFIKRLDALYDEVRDEKGGPAHLIEEVQKLKNDVKHLRKGGPLVFFRAYLSRKRAFGKGKTVVFDKQEVNIGNGYNRRTGIFRAPVSGLYEFKCQLEATGPGTSDYMITNDGREKAHLTILNEWESNIMSVIFHVKAGKEVKIVGHHDNGKKPELRDGTWSLFSGYLLRRD